MAAACINLAVLNDPLRAPGDTLLYFSLTPACGALQGWTTLSLATRGNNMDPNTNINKNQNLNSPFIGFDIEEMELAGSPLSESLMLTEEEELCLAEDTMVNSEPQVAHTGVSDSTVIPEEIERSARAQEPVRISGAQRRKLIKAKLLERGEVYKPRKKNKYPKRGKYNPALSTRQIDQAGPSGLGQASCASEPAGQPRLVATSLVRQSGEGVEQTPKTGKRNRSEGSTPASTRGPTKKPREDVEALTFKQVLSGISLSVVKKEHPDAKLSQEDGDKLRQAIIDKLVEYRGLRLPKFDKTSYDPAGAITFLCGDEFTAQWLSTIIDALNPFNGIVLRIGPTKTVLRTSKILMWVPKTTYDKRVPETLKLLERQNEGVLTSKWQVKSSRREPLGQTIVCLIDEDSLAALKRIGLKPYLALDRINVRIISDATISKSENGAANQPPAQ